MTKHYFIIKIFSSAHVQTHSNLKKSLSKYGEHFLGRRYGDRKHWRRGTILQ